MQDADPLFHADRFRDREDKIPRVLGAESAGEQPSPQKECQGEQVHTLWYSVPSASAE
jgi:hypothetical protein